MTSLKKTFGHHSTLIGGLWQQLSLQMRKKNWTILYPQTKERGGGRKHKEIGMEETGMEEMEAEERVAEEMGAEETGVKEVDPGRSAGTVEPKDQEQSK